MNRRRKRLSVFALLLVFFMLGGITFPASGQTGYFVGEAEAYYEDLLDKGFPESYARPLTELHLLHPQWSFTPLLITETEPTYTWDYVLAQECHEPDNNLIYSSASYLAYQHPLNFTLYDSSWRQVSHEGLAYFMDPRNFLNETDIFQFYDLTSYETVTEEAVASVLMGTFMENAYLENGKTYAAYFFDVGNALGINPIYLAVKARQEQGAKGTSPIISGQCGSLLDTYYRDKTQVSESGNQILTPSDGYSSEELLELDHLYNVFNISASGNGLFKIYYGAMNRAKKGSPEMEEAWGGSPSWNTIWKSIYGGALVIKKQYVDAYKNTIYLNKFNVDSRADGNFYSQYMQNVSGALSEARTLYSSFAYGDALDTSCEFLIPVYGDMPNDPSPDPANGTCSSLAIAPRKYDYAVSISLADIQATENAAQYAELQMTWLEQLHLRGLIEHSYGVKGLEYRLDDGDWIRFSNQGTFDTVLPLHFSSPSEHILTIRGVADYDHSVSTKKCNQYFLCAVFYIHIVEPPTATVSFTNGEETQTLEAYVGSTYRLPKTEDPNFIGWLGSDDSFFPEDTSLILEEDVSYTALSLSRFEQMEGAALIFSESGVRMRFSAAMEKETFDMLLPLSSHVRFSATLKMQEEEVETELSFEDVVHAFGIDWQMICADTEEIDPANFDLPYSITFSVLRKFSNETNYILFQEAYIEPFTRTAREIATMGLQDTDVQYADWLLERLEEITQN